jgi:2-polyprenyl-6-methoxyphenol hydroxylase-like FAD-dependent oxidoreductase
VSAGGAVAGALRAYEAERMQRTAWLVAQSRRIGAVGQWHNPLGVAVRDMLIKVLGARLQERQLVRVMGHEV